MPSLEGEADRHGLSQAHVREGSNQGLWWKQFFLVLGRGLHAVPGPEPRRLVLVAMTGMPLLGCILAWEVLRVSQAQVSSECAEEGVGPHRAALRPPRATCSP